MKSGGCGQVLLAAVLLLGACLVFAALAGALIGTGELPLYGPSLTGLEPDPNATILPTTAITLTFDQKMDVESVEAALDLAAVDGSHEPPGIFQWNETRDKMTFVPQGEGLLPGSTYRLRLSPEARAGTLPRTLGRSFEWTFGLAPLVDSVSPASAVSDSDAWPILQAEFGYELNCEATLATFAIAPETAGALTCQHQTVVFSSTQPLEPGTAYATQVESVYLKDDAWPRPGVSWQLETVPPLVIVDASPVDGSILADLWTPVQILFNRPIVAESARDRFVLSTTEGQELPSEVTWLDEGARLVFQPKAPLLPDKEYKFRLEAGTADRLGFKIEAALAQSFGTEPMLVGIAPANGKYNLPLDEVLRVTFGRAMDTESVADGLQIVPDVEGQIAWEGNTLLFAPVGGWAPDTEYQATVGDEVRDASGAPLGAVPSTGAPSSAPRTWSFGTRPLLVKTSPSPGKVLTELGTPIEYSFALPMDRSSVEAALEVEPPVEGEIFWAPDSRSLVFGPDPALQPGTTYEVTLSGSARTEGGHHALGEAHSFSFGTDRYGVDFGYGPNVQVMDAEGSRAFQFVTRGADTIDFALYAITPTQFLDLYSSGFRGIGPSESQVIDTGSLPATYEWRQTPVQLVTGSTREWLPAEASIPTEVPTGLYLLASPGSEAETEETAGALLVALTHHTLVLKQALTGDGSRSNAQVVAWDTQIGDGSPVVSATVRLYDRDGSFLAEAETGKDGLLAAHVPGDPGPLLALSDKDGDLTVCGLSNEWSESGWWWWWTQPASQPLYTTYSYTDRPIYRPAQTVYYRDWIRANDDVSYTLPAADLPVTVRLRDARDNVASSQILTPTQFGTVHGEFQLAGEPMLGTWHLETEVDGAVTRQPLQVEEYRKPEYEVTVRTPQNVYVQGETISLTVDAAYYFGQPVAGAQVELLAYPTYDEAFFGPEGSSYGYPVFAERGHTGDDGQWRVTLPSEDVFYRGNRAHKVKLALEATVADETGQSVSSYQNVIVQRTSQGLTLLLDRMGYQPNETIAFSTAVRDRDGQPAEGIEVQARVLGWDGNEAASAVATTGDSGQALFSVRLAEQGWYDILVTGKDDGGREMETRAYFWIYDPTGRAPWYQGEWVESPDLSVRADRSSYAPGDEAQLAVYSPHPGPALLTFERGKTQQAKPVDLISGTTLITVPILPGYGPNIHVTVNQFGPPALGPWEAQSRPEAQLHKASIELLVPMESKALTVTLTPDRQDYGPGDEATFQIQVFDRQGQPVVAEVSLAVVDEAIYALAQDMSQDPFEVFYAPRANLVRTFDSLHPTRWLYREGPGLGGGDEEGAGGPRRNFQDTAYWAPTVVTSEAGTATVSLQLPDNLTEWRALARAVTTDTLVGQATASIVTAKDIVVRPALPRFIVEGDTITLTAVVHNFTGQAVSATVELEVEGLEFISEESASPQIIHVTSQGTATAGWPVRAGLPVGADQEAAAARVLVKATATYGARLVGRDAIELPLTVHPLAVPEVATMAGTLTPERPTETITITLPQDAIEGLSRMEVNLAPSVAPGLLNGLEYLIDYPFG